MGGELDFTEALDLRLNALGLTRDLIWQFMDLLELAPGIEYVLP